MKPVEIMNGLIGVSPSKLTPEQRQVQMVMDFDTEVMNGGWDQYLRNTSGNGADEFRVLARSLGYAGIAEELDLIAERMGGQIPVDRELRTSYLTALKGNLTDDEDREIDRLIRLNLNDLFGDNCKFIEAHATSLLDAAKKPGG